MAIIPVTTQAEIEKYIEQQIERFNRVLIRTMSYVGEQCVSTARSSHTYKDQTGNLTSSIGYAVSVDGRLVESSSFGQVINGGEGSQSGKEYVEKLIAKFPKGVALIVVAGMNYASYVSDKGYDVIDSAENLAQSLVPRMLKQLGIKV